jgi:hypothetical protein
MTGTAMNDFMRPIRSAVLYLLSSVLLLAGCNDLANGVSGVGGTDAGPAGARIIQSLGPDEHGEVIFRGVVSENITACEVDAFCLLRILVDEELVTVVYHYGEMPRCQNDQATSQGFALSPGDEVEVYGAVYEASSISTCDADRYYLLKLVSP